MQENSYQPIFFRNVIQEDNEKRKLLLEQKPYVQIYDSINLQLTDLIKAKFPKQKLNAEEYDIAIRQHLNGIPAEDYGVWVYYPWCERLVHLLDEKEFVQLRTNRNKYKITEDEAQILAGKKIGVVGLSVGQSVSLTLAMERSIGELRIADFDTLDLTNLNRIRSGVHNIGIRKTVIVAREIAEMDPFLKVTLFSEGLTNENMDAFFTDGGQLDIVIDECDGLDMKILLRHKAKALRIPVVMDTSDRGMLDVERFDLEPTRPILHGYIEHLDHKNLKGPLTNEQKIPYMMPMLGIDTISKRFKASMVEVEQTINTWPQLASAVTLGGALCADVCRRILLDQYHESGRYFIDLEEIAGDKPHKMEGDYIAEDLDFPALEDEYLRSSISALPARPSSASKEQLQYLIEAALWAPSAGNNQPWKWVSSNGALYLFHEKKLSITWADEESFISNISFGTALENVRIKAATLGLQPTIELYPAGKDSLLIAAVYLSPESAKNEPLAEYIGTRCTNRKKGDLSIISSDKMDQLRSSAVQVEGAAVSFLENRDDIKKLADIVAAADRLRFLYPQAHHDFYSKEIRWNENGTEYVADGLDIKTLEMKLSDTVGLKVASDPAVIALLNKWQTGSAFEKMFRESINTSSSIALFTMPGFSPEAFIEGGRAVERFWLSAAALNIAIHPISSPVFLYNKITFGSDKGVNDAMRSEIVLRYEQLSELFPELQAGRLGIFLCRLSHSEPPTARSLRKSVEDLYLAL